MILGGDEIGRSQNGNNNAYCQDNEISWFDWEAVDEELLQFTRGLIRMRAEHPVFRRRHWFEGVEIRGAPDISWFSPDGRDMTEEDWQTGFAKSLGVFLNGEGIGTPGPQGERIVDRSFVLLFNAHHAPLEFKLPQRLKRGWQKVLDTNVETLAEPLKEIDLHAPIVVAGRSIVVLRDTD